MKRSSKFILTLMAGIGCYATFFGSTMYTQQQEFDASCSKVDGSVRSFRLIKPLQEAQLHDSMMRANLSNFIVQYALLRESRHIVADATESYEEMIQQLNAAYLEYPALYEKMLLLLDDAEFISFRESLFLTASKTRFNDVMSLLTPRFSYTIQTSESGSSSYYATYCLRNDEGILEQHDGHYYNAEKTMKERRFLQALESLTETLVIKHAFQTKFVHKHLETYFGTRLP